MSPGRPASKEIPSRRSKLEPGFTNTFQTQDVVALVPRPREPHLGVPAGRGPRREVPAALPGVGPRKHPVGQRRGGHGVANELMLVLSLEN